MQLRSSAAGPARRPSPVTLWLVIAVCAAPLIASYLAYYWWRPSAQLNYGELLEPRPWPDEALATDARSRLRALRGKWVLLTADRAACDERCRAKLTYLRQVRLAQGKESERIERVWLITDHGSPDPSLLDQHPGLIVLRAGAEDLERALPAVSAATEHIYVVDPLGNLMMRFPSDPDPRRILKDVSRLLRHSKWK